MGERQTDRQTDRQTEKLRDRERERSERQREWGRKRGGQSHRVGSEGETQPERTRQMGRGEGER